MSFQKFFKEIIDPLGAIAGLMITSPLFLVLAVLIKLDSKGPVFFKQERAGKDGKPFLMYKFRSMVDKAEKLGLGQAVIIGDPRITRMGKFLRDWTLDEWPQLINVLKGEMSLVGPRPLPLSQTATFNDFQKKRLRVKPGMVSLVDVRGRNLVPWPKRFEMDVWYVDNWSLWLDLKILFSVPRIVLGREGIYGQEGINKPYQASTKHPQNR